MRLILTLILALSSYSFGLRADLNRDGIVDLQDLAILSEEWLMSEYGANLVTNGTFDTDSGWTKGTGWTINTTTKKAVFNYGITYSSLIQTLTLVQGKSYSVAYTIGSMAGGLSVTVTLGGQDGTTRSADGTYTETIVVDTPTQTIEFTPSAADGADTFTIDDVTVKEVYNVGSLWEQALMQTVLGDAACAAYLGNNMFNNYAPPTITKPYVIYEQISGPRDQTFDGPSGLVTIHIQLNSFATTYLECRTIADVIRRKLDGFEGTVSLTGGGSCKVLETKLIDEGDIPSERPDNTVVYGKRQDYEMVIDERP